MAGKYYYKNSANETTDVTSPSEPQRFTAADFHTYYTGETDTMQKAGTDTTNVTFTGYSINGTTCTAVKRGYCPSYNYSLSPIWESSTPGTYTITRTDTTLTVGSTTYYPSNFSCGCIPHEIVVLIVGGGGGGGGTDYREAAGGGGGGGGLAIARISLDSITTPTITIGAGGSAGVHGVAFDRKGEKGGDGDPSYLKSSTGTTILTAGGGKGGTGGTGQETSNSDYGTGGAGGTASAASAYCEVYAIRDGGKGNDKNNFEQGDTYSCAFLSTSGTGDQGGSLGGNIMSLSTSSVQLVTKDYMSGSTIGTVTLSFMYNGNKNYNESNAITSSGYTFYEYPDASYYTGGGSLGEGGYLSYDQVSYAYRNGQLMKTDYSWTLHTPTKGGGGAAGGRGTKNMRCAGANGYAAIYY